MSLKSYQKEQIINHFHRAPMDTGSSEVQIALLTYRISQLTEHFKIHRKDNHGRKGLITLVNQRKKLLKYFKRKNPDGYTQLIGQLSLRK